MKYNRPYELAKQETIHITITGIRNMEAQVTGL